MTDITHHNLQNGPAGISRRTFIKGIGIALAGGVLLAAGGGRLTQTLWVRQVQPGDLNRSMLSRRLGEAFHVQLDSSDVVAMQLVQVRDLGIGASQDANNKISVDMEHSYSAVFRGPGDRPLPQATYQFKHDQIGRFPLFIVPMSTTNDARYYEAVFNRSPA